MQNIPEIENLIKLISKLPGLGPKSAKRIILKMINNRQELLKPLAQNLSEVFKNVVRCKICGTLKPNTIECSYNNCEIVEKKYNKICVVENISDQWAIESSSIFQGYYHILGGTISDTDNSNNRENLLINSCLLFIIFKIILFADLGPRPGNFDINLIKFSIQEYFAFNL